MKLNKKQLNIVHKLRRKYVGHEYAHDALIYYLLSEKGGENDDEKDIERKLRKAIAFYQSDQGEKVYEKISDHLSRKEKHRDDDFQNHVDNHGVQNPGQVHVQNDRIYDQVDAPDQQIYDHDNRDPGQIYVQNDDQVDDHDDDQVDDHDDDQVDDHDDQIHVQKDQVDDHDDSHKNDDSHKYDDDDMYEFYEYDHEKANAAKHKNGLRLLKPGHVSPEQIAVQALSVFRKTIS